MGRAPAAPILRQRRARKAEAVSKKKSYQELGLVRLESKRSFWSRDVRRPARVSKLRTDAKPTRVELQPSGEGEARIPALSHVGRIRNINRPDSLRLRDQVVYRDLARPVNRADVPDDSAARDKRSPAPAETILRRCRNVPGISFRVERCRRKHAVVENCDHADVAHSLKQRAGFKTEMRSPLELDHRADRVAARSRRILAAAVQIGGAARLKVLGQRDAGFEAEVNALRRRA